MVCAHIEHLSFSNPGVRLDITSLISCSIQIFPHMELQPPQTQLYKDDITERNVVQLIVETAHYFEPAVPTGLPRCYTGLGFIQPFNSLQSPCDFTAAPQRRV